MYDCLKMKQIREEKNVTQNEISEATGVSVPFLSRVENGEKIPTLALAYSIAKCLGVTLHDLVGEEKEKKEEH